MGDGVENARLSDAIHRLRAAESELARCSLLLAQHRGSAIRKQWWYDVNRLYHSSHALSETLREGLREALVRGDDQVVLNGGVLEDICVCGHERIVHEQEGEGCSHAWCCCPQFEMGRPADA